MRTALLLAALAAAWPARAEPRLQLGLGDRYDQVVAGRRVVVYRQAARDGLRFKYVALWLTPGWTRWVDRDLLRRIAADGYTPLLLYYTLGDRGSREYLEAHGEANLKAWRADIQDRLIPLINIDSEVLVALEPEFNVVPASGTPLTAWGRWGEVAARTVDLIHRGAPRAKVGFCPGDWGNYDLEPSLRAAALRSDFIAFPEMRAATDPTRDAASAPYQDVAGAALAFSAYLKKSFHKPILLAYLALSSYSDARHPGWDDVQARIIARLFARRRELLANGVFALAYFSYYDDPAHGTEFFGEAERHFGLKDAQGRPKKAWYAWKEGGEKR